MRPIRVLIVDDSRTVRQMVASIIARDPDLELVGSAANGRIALEQIPQLSPDVVILNVEMPEMGGLQTLAELRKSRPRLPVIMFSTLTSRGAALTLEALSLGAADYLTKPTTLGGMDLSVEAVSADLLARIKFFGARAAGLTVPPSPKPPRPRAADAPPSSHDIAIVAIGASTGGPCALPAVLSQLPPDFAVPVVIAQHMPPLFTKSLAERLAAQCPLRVGEGAPGTPLEPAHAYLAPGDHHMVVERRAGAVVIGTNQDPPVNSCRPAVDVLFRSVASVYGPGAVGVILT
jgi:two-component system chemotaxis response regulator CheB